MALCALPPSSMLLAHSTRSPVWLRKTLPTIRPGNRRSVTPKAKNDTTEPDNVLQCCPVPKDQQPMQELQSLQRSFLFDWAALPLSQFAVRLAAVYLAFLAAAGFPVAAVTFSPSEEPLQCFLAASAGSLFIATVLVLVLYVGYSHVGSRLLSAVVVYEETGWYDGQVWVKPPEVLTRDRLLGAYSVRPVLERLKTSLLSLGGGLAACMLLLASLPAPQVYSAGVADTATNVAAAAAVPVRDYEEVVARFEPWTGAKAPEEAPNWLMSHMQAYSDEADE